MSRQINNTSSQPETSGQLGASTITQTEDERDIVEANSETDTSGQVGASTINQVEDERDIVESNSETDTSGQVGTSTLSQVENERDVDGEFGKEIVINGDYSESGVGNVISQSGGILVNENNKLKITSNGSSGFSRGIWNTNGSIGDRFLIKADIVSIIGSTRFVNISDNVSQSLVEGAFSTTIIIGSGGLAQVGFGGLIDSSFELVIDNVSIKQIGLFDDTSGQVGASTITQIENERTINTGFGPELVTNGSFDTDSDWNVGTGWNISGGVVSANSPTGNLDQAVTVLSGKTYRVEFTVSNYVSGDVRFRFTGTSNENGALRTANGTYVEEITLTNNQSIFRFPATGGVMDIDGVSVKEVL